MHFYKILSRDEIHYQMHYKTGLNVDILEFNPTGNCKSGGIYFAREDILAFIEIGPWIRRVTLPKDAQVYKNPGSPKKWKADKVILGRKYQITAKVIERLINEGANPDVNYHVALKWASRFGNVDIVKVLIDKSKSIKKSEINSALNDAVFYNHVDIVKSLIPISNPSFDRCRLLTTATRCNNIPIIKLLIPHLDIKSNGCDALTWATINGNRKIMKLLIPISTQEDIDEAVRSAVKWVKKEVVNILIPVASKEVLVELGLD